MAFYKTEDEIKEGLFGTTNVDISSTNQKPVSNSSVRKAEVEINYLNNPVNEIPKVEEPPLTIKSEIKPLSQVNNEVKIETPVENVKPVETVSTEKESLPETIKQEEQHFATEVKEKVDSALKIITEEEKAKMEAEAKEEEAKRIAEIDKHSIEYLKLNDIDVDSGINILGDLDTYNSMLKEFYKTSKDIFGKLIEYKATKDIAKYAEQSYSLKNNSNYFGFVKLCEYAKDHELKAKDNDFNYINEHFKEYDDELMRIVDVLNNYFN